MSRQVLLHRNLVQQVLSRIPSDATILKDIFRALPLLSSLPQVFKWGDIYLPIFLFRIVFGYGGLVAMLKGMLVSKEWYQLLTTSKGWDYGVWKVGYEKESHQKESDKEGGKKKTGSKLDDGKTTSYWRKKATQWFYENERKRVAEIRRKFREKEGNTRREEDLVLLT